jgi:hypothetical protein
MILFDKLDDEYRGEWIKCQKHGKGEDYFANGDSYIGFYENSIYI